jgi:hypothetical protein
MRRREFITLLPFAAGLPSSAALAVELNEHFVGSLDREVNVKRDFGATGDGITDDWQAIENAGIYLEARGGGRMYFPAGRYKLPTFGKNITVRNNIEYCGDGASSVIVGSNAAFISPNGAVFGRGSYATYTYYGVHDILAGAQSLTTTVLADADNFSPGDIIIARSITAAGSANDVLPHFVEMNRVVSVHGGVVNLEDPIDDGWNGVMIARVSDDVSQGYSIHDLRIECESGFPFFIQASYKSVIRNCWTRGLSVICANGFTRSVAHDLIATVVWSAERMEALFEIETGSVRASIRDIEIQMTGTSLPGGQYPLFYCQEFSRRTSLRNVRVAAGGISLGNVITAFAGGHSFENIDVVARSIDKVLDYSCGDPAVFSLNHLPATFKGVAVDALDATNGFNHGFILYNNYPKGAVENVTVQDCVINGVADEREHNLIWFLRGEQSDILFENVRGAADVTMGLRERGMPDPSLRNVQLRNCEYRRIGSEAMFERAHFVGCRRKDSRLPGPSRLPSGQVWASNVANGAMMALVVPAYATVCRGDYIELRFSGRYADPYGAHATITAFGTSVITIDLIPSVDQAVNIDLRVSFAGNSFAAPDKYLVTGVATINNGILPALTRSPGIFDVSMPNLVELQAWSGRSDAGGWGFVVESATIAYFCVED